MESSHAIATSGNRRMFTVKIQDPAGHKSFRNNEIIFFQAIQTFTGYNEIPRL